MTQNIAILLMSLLPVSVLYIYIKLRAINSMNHRMQKQISEYFTGDGEDLSSLVNSNVDKLWHDQFVGEVLNDYRLNEMLKAENYQHEEH
jgi:hypothetical protein